MGSSMFVSLQTVNASFFSNIISTGNFLFLPFHVCTNILRIGCSYTINHIVKRKKMIFIFISSRNECEKKKKFREKELSIKKGPINYCFIDYLNRQLERHPLILILLHWLLPEGKITSNV